MAMRLGSLYIGNSRAAGAASVLLAASKLYTRTTSSALLEATICVLLGEKATLVAGALVRLATACPTAPEFVSTG